MAKALLGHTGGPNQLLAAELHRLHQRVCDLEAELARLKDEQADAADDSGHPRTVPSRTARGWPVVPASGLQAAPEPRSSSSSLARPPTA
jgi:hypothetical protein